MAPSSTVTPDDRNGPACPLAEGDRVAAELLGPPGRRQGLRVPLGRADQPAGDRVLDIRQDVEHLESHDAFLPDLPGIRRTRPVGMSAGVYFAQDHSLRP
jgi:hypothetical protein